MVRIVKSELICSNCGNICYVCRKKSNQKKINDLNYIYCYKCKEIKEHIELSDSSLYKKRLEFKCDLTDKEENILSLLNNTENKIKVLKLQNDRY